MPITDLPIVGYYDEQRFKQFGPATCSNWYMVTSEIGKKKVAMYPVMGRRHITALGQNQLIFGDQPRAIFKSINFAYIVVGDRIFREDANFNQIEVTAGLKLNTLTGNIFFTYIVVSASKTVSVPSITFCCFTDGQNFYLYREETQEFGIITDPNMPALPWVLATFGNRVVVSTYNSSTFGLSEINLNYNATFATMLTTAFTIAGAAVFAQEAGIIRQMGVLQNILYIFTDFTTGPWANIPSTFTAAGGTQTTFPWKKNSSYDWDFGIADPNSLDVDFGYIAWLAQNRNGIIQIMVSTGGKPEGITSEAIDVLLQRIVNAEEINPEVNPFSSDLSDGFLYDYENTVFYRLSAGKYDFGPITNQLLDQVSTSNSIEYNFDTKTWHKCIELNGGRNRIQDHIFFHGRHLVTVEGDSTVYEMSGRFYTNEISNPAQPNRYADDAYLELPFRYERTTPIICSGTVELLTKLGAAYYDEFITDWVDIDFVFGEGTFSNSDQPFGNTKFIIGEAPDSLGDPVYIVAEDGTTYLITEDGNIPYLGAKTYNNWFKPHIELYFSNDGGVSFQTADIREFSQIGVTQWRMRWYQLGASRNRVYKLICVSPAPIVILGAQMSVRRASGPAA